MEWILFIIGLTSGFVIFTKAPEQPAEGVPGDKTRNGTARTAIKLGWISLVAWLLPLVGWPVTIMGLILANRSKGSQYDSVNNSNTHCAIGLVLTMINSWLGLMLL